MRAVALCVLFPIAALAQTSVPAPPASEPAAAGPTAERDARWSIGAGVAFTTTTILGTSPVGVLGVQPSVPGVAASLERRLSERTWLVLGVSGTIDRQKQELPSGTTGTSRNDVNQLALGAGARYVVTPAGAPVDVSAVALAEGGVVSGRTDSSALEFTGGGFTTTSTTYDTSGWSLGANLGIAVDRVLTGALSLRVATPLVGATYTSTRTKVSGQTLDGSDFSASVIIAPRLELRLAF